MTYAATYAATYRLTIDDAVRCSRSACCRCATRVRLSILAAYLNRQCFHSQGSDCCVDLEVCMADAQAEHASLQPCQSKPLHSYKAQQLYNLDSQVHSGNRQIAAVAAGLVHSCLSPPRVLRRNSSGLPSATATYTALRKAAAGGTLIPDFCQPNSVGGRRRTSHDLHGSKPGNKLHAFQQCQHTDRSELHFPSKQVRKSTMCVIAICGLLSWRP